MWLAERGWVVTGLDLSSVALGRGRAAAADRGVGDRCTWVAGDVLAWRPPARFDLVASHYVHEAPDTRVAYWRAAAQAVAPGGILLIVGHHPSDRPAEGRGPRDPAVLFSPGDVVEALADDPTLATLIAQTRPRPVREGSGSEGRVETVVVMKRDGVPE